MRTLDLFIDRRLRGAVKKKHSLFKDIIQIEVDPPPSQPIFDKFIFWQSVDRVDLPPSPRIFDKNYEILGFETYILHYCQAQSSPSLAGLS